MRLTKVLTTLLVIVLLAALTGTASAQTFSFGGDGWWVSIGPVCPSPFLGGYSPGYGGFNPSYSPFGSSSLFGYSNPFRENQFSSFGNRFGDTSCLPYDPNLAQQANLEAKINGLNNEQRLLSDRLRVAKALFQAGYITRQAYESERSSLEARRTQLYNEANLASAQLRLLRDLRRY